MPKRVAVKVTPYSEKSPRFVPDRHGTAAAWDDADHLRRTGYPLQTPE